MVKTKFGIFHLCRQINDMHIRYFPSMTTKKIRQSECCFLSTVDGKQRICMPFIHPSAAENSAQIILFSIDCGRITGMLNNILQYFLSMLDEFSTTFCLCEVAICHSVTTEAISCCYHDHRWQLLGWRNGLSKFSTHKELRPSLNSLVNWA